MSENWKTYKLSEVAEIKYGKDHKGLNDGDIPLYGTGGIMRFVDRFLYENESVLIPRKGSLNNIYYINKPFWTVDTLFWTKINAELIFPKYFYYNLKTIDFASKDVGSAVPSLTTSLLNRIEIYLPPLPEQRAIASILSAIDDKIEINLQMNKTLEEMAMTLYKHWFVDFGPFKDGEFVDSELGRIPKGWEVKRLEDVFSVKDGTHDSPKQKDEGHYLITSKHIKKNEIDLSSAYKISAEDFQKVNQRSKVDSGDILMTMIGTVGVFYLVNRTPNYAIKNIGLFKTSEVLELKYYSFLFFTSDFSSQFIKSQLAGSTQQYLTLTVLRSFPFLHPIKSCIESFNTIVSGYFEMIENNITENQTLTTLRDTLLPKLISGEVRVKEAEKILEETL